MGQSDEEACHHSVPHHAALLPTVMLRLYKYHP